VLYGTTNRGGPDNAGTVFDLFPPATEGGVWAASVLYIFEGLPGGAAPYNMILGPDGSLYGATEGRIPDGNYGAGTVFQLTPPASPGGSWTETTLHTLEYDTFNCGPDSPLILHVGNLYGASCLKGGGVVFELQPPTEPGGAWTEVPLHTFTNGQIPAGAMVMTESGTIYGATALPYGETPGGTIFEITMQ
jgi:hypothetical protein